MQFLGTFSVGAMLAWALVYGMLGHIVRNTFITTTPGFILVSIVGGIVGCIISSIIFGRK